MAGGIVSRWFNQLSKGGFNDREATLFALTADNLEKGQDFIDALIAENAGENYEITFDSINRL